MLNPETRVGPNADEVAAKVIDGEAILINLTSGMYYSMDRVGGVIWELIDGTPTAAEIVDAVAGAYEVDRERADSDVRELLAQLVEAGLIVIRSDAAERRSLAGTTPATSRLPYEPPRLHAYDDMAELLALDPPHPLLTNTLAKFSG